MKKILIPIMTVLLSVMIIAILPTEAEAGIYADTIRIHILANSDEKYDQELKLHVRDRLLSEYSNIFDTCREIRDAENTLKDALYDIESDVNTWIADYGYTATAELEVEWFDTRYYDGFSLPAGYYLSLIISIGEAKGQNWWCVMYPPMCLDSATKIEAEYSDAEKNLILGKYTVKFKILELISKSIGKK